MVEQSQELLKVAGGSSLLFSSWEDKETVVYHCLSGDTHTLNPVATAIVKALDESPASTQKFPALMANKLNYHDDEAFRAYVEEVIGELRKTGLVEIVE